MGRGSLLQKLLLDDQIYEDAQNFLSNHSYCYTRLPVKDTSAGPLAYRLPTPSACGLLCFFELNRVIPLLRDDHPCAFIAPFAVRVGAHPWLMRDYSLRERPVRPEQRVLLAFIFSSRRTFQPSVLLLSVCGVERIAIAH